MCGIFGAIDADCVGKTISALHFLEYRGYDSAGICAKVGDRLCLYKAVGRVSVLESRLPHDFHGRNAIGHTRWATHGQVSDINAHPFLSADKTFAICHNGILENFSQLKSLLRSEGFGFSSDTDSETVAHLLQHNFDGDVPLKSVQKTAKMLRGSFAVLIETLHDDNLYAMRCKSPLCVGLCGKSIFICSDVRCVSRLADKIAVVPDMTIVKAGESGVFFFDFDGNELKADFHPSPKLEFADVGSGDCMLKEIFEIPSRLVDCKRGYFESGGLGLSAKTAKSLRRIYFLGCGTAFNSGAETAAVARNFCRLDMLAVRASEFVYDNYPVDGRTLAFCISQSGETADTLRAAEKVRHSGGICYAVTNTEVSSLSFLCDNLKNVYAADEFAVASTKAYNCQLQTLLLLMLDIAVLRGELDEETRKLVQSEMDRLPFAVGKVLEASPQIADVANRLKDCSAVFFLGRTSDYPTAVEGSLKLKEISYIHSEAYPSGELKHGTLALMTDGIAAVLLSTDPLLLQKNASTAREVASRKASVITISPYVCEKPCISIPETHKFLHGIVSVVPLQLLAYHTAKALGRDVDKPRNLAKSVTVE